MATRWEVRQHADFATCEETEEGPALRYHARIPLFQTISWSAALSHQEGIECPITIVILDLGGSEAKKIPRPYSVRSFFAAKLSDNQNNFAAIYFNRSSPQG